jgi:hypothetical protein
MSLLLRLLGDVIFDGVGDTLRFRLMLSLPFGDPVSAAAAAAASTGELGWLLPPPPPPPAPAPPNEPFASARGEAVHSPL